MKKRTKKRMQKIIDLFVITIDIAFYSYLIINIVQNYILK